MTINPDMLQLARESRGLNRTELANSVDVTQPYISQIETGQRSPSDDVMKRICGTLKYPMSFFTQHDDVLGIGMSVFFYRKKASTKVADIRRLEAEVNIRCLQVRRLLSEVDIQTPSRIALLDIDEHAGDAETIAGLVRASWRLPVGPVKNLVRSIEKAGGIVFKFPFDTSEIDAVSQWPVDTPPLFFVNANAPADRMRFSLAHELGHVVMHQTASETMEDEANRFASEFLMPRKDIASDLGGMTLGKAASLKPLWRVSMAALIRRARDLGRLSQRDYQRLMRRLSATGQRKRELVDIPGEEPHVLKQIIGELSDSCGYDRGDLARLTCVSLEDFVDRFDCDSTQLRLAR
jgi:Zn-dependent peptidase ImmA (M78 family)/DNA-binding XRE family transcriptional regulator